jgi:hypothetical protein
MIAPDDPRVTAAMRHLDRRAEDGRCGQMVADMLTAALEVDAGDAAKEPTGEVDADVPINAAIAPNLYMWCDRLLDRTEDIGVKLRLLQREIHLLRDAAKKLRNKP